MGDGWALFLGQEYHIVKWKTSPGDTCETLDTGGAALGPELGMGRGPFPSPGTPGKGSTWWILGRGKEGPSFR